MAAMLKPGDRIVVRLATGTRVGEVTATYPVDDEDDEGVKNGRPGYDYKSGDLEFWCYSNQVVS
jgi:hypothetical protein